MVVALVETALTLPCRRVFLLNQKTETAASGVLKYAFCSWLPKIKYEMHLNDKDYYFDYTRDLWFLISIESVLASS